MDCFPNWAVPAPLPRGLHAPPGLQTDRPNGTARSGKQVVAAPAAEQTRLALAAEHCRSALAAEHCRSASAAEHCRSASAAGHCRSASAAAADIRSWENSSGCLCHKNKYKIPCKIDKSTPCPIVFHSFFEKTHLFKSFRSFRPIGFPLEQMPKATTSSQQGNNTKGENTNGIDGLHQRRIARHHRMAR